ncbi:hypothetical protein GGI13_006024, partial [Coemansia sp. RSA 455]
LKNPAYAAACTICEAPRPGASVTIPAADITAGDDRSAKADAGRLDDHLSSPSDSDASEDAGSDDGYANRYSEDEDEAEGELSDEDKGEGELSDEDEGEHADGSVEAAESNLASDEESECELDAAKEDVEASSGDMSGIDPVGHPVLSYADAAKVALADHIGEGAVLEDNAVSAPDHLDDVVDAPMETGGSEAPIETGGSEAPIELAPTSPGSIQLDERDQEHDHDHDHDSDGFVHVSQLESGQQSKAGFSQVDDDDDGVLSVAASETSLDTPTDNAPSTGEHVSDMASDLDDLNQDPSETSDTESKILAAVSDELDRGIPEERAPVSEDPQHSTEPVAVSELELPSQHPLLDAHLVCFLSGASIAQVVDQALRYHASTPGPVVVAEEPDSAAAAANDDDVAPESAMADAESKVEVAEEAHALPPAVVLQPGDSDVTTGPAIGADLTPPPQALVEQHDEAAPAFALGELAAGIESALGDTNAAEDDSSTPPQPGAALETGAPVSVVEQAPASNAAATPAWLPATSEPGAKSFFKAGRLGSFGGQLGKNLTGASTTTPYGQAASAFNSSVLPNAFSATATTSTTAFGAKLDRPAFGIASMSSFGASSQSGQQQSTISSSGSFVNMGKIGAGFSSRASASIDPFAAYKGTSNFLGTSADDAAAGSSGKSSPQPNLDNSSARIPESNSSPRQTPKTSSKLATLQPSPKDIDPILSIIHGSDSEVDKDDLDGNYDSE